MDTVQYLRKGRVRAVIYVCGQDEGIQEIMCRLYSEDKGYDVVGVVKNIEDACNCDVLLVANFSRISRKKMTLVKTYKLFKARGIRVESVTGQHDINGLFSAEDIYKSLEKFFEKEFKKQ